MEEEAVNKKAEEGKKKKRTSLKSILEEISSPQTFSAGRRSCWY